MVPRCAHCYNALPTPRRHPCPSLPLSAPPTGGNGALGEALNAREQLTVAAASCAAGQVLAPGVDYLVGCEYNAAADQLWVMAGNNAGAVGFFPVVEPPAAGQQPAAGDGAATAAQQAPLFGAPAAALPSGAGAHGDVVRSVLWPGAAGGMCLSGGEDSKVCAWSLVPMAAAAGPWAAAAAPRGGGSPEGGAVRKHHHQHSVGQHANGGGHHQRRVAPY